MTYCVPYDKWEYTPLRSRFLRFESQGVCTAPGISGVVDGVGDVATVMGAFWETKAPGKFPGVKQACVDIQLVGHLSDNNEEQSVIGYFTSDTKWSYLKVCLGPGQLECVRICYKDAD